MKFQELDEFKKDLKKLLKRYRTLGEDLDVVKKVLSVEPKERPPFSYKIEGLGLATCVIKVKKMTCKSLKGKGANSGLRLIYAHFEAEKLIVFAELYHKSDKENEDKERMKNNFK
jgi:mRNA-degrading endonuclease RelE of RelBE toxin-antitoxin system